MKLHKFFDRSEFACKCGCGRDTVDAELLDVLVRLREFYGAPVVITSGFRCEQHNKDVGGSKNSRHLEGKAADIRVLGVHADVVADWLQFEYPQQYGIGRYEGRTHIDVRQHRARWDKRVI